MMRSKAGRREAQPEDPRPRAHASAVALEIEELEPRLTPDYFGLTGFGSGHGGHGGPGAPPGRTVGWGC